jgi:hypothetical protein
VLPIFILKLAHRDNDENNHCHRQEDINSHHAHIVPDSGIARELTLGVTQHCPLMQRGNFAPIYPDDGVGFDRGSGNFGRWRSAAVDDPIVNTDVAPAGRKIIAPYLDPDRLTDRQA